MSLTLLLRSTAKLKAATKYHSYGGLHRADIWNCLARLTQYGLVTREKLITIRQASQQEIDAAAIYEAGGYLHH